MIRIQNIDLHAIVSRLRRTGDAEAADAIDRLVSDLTHSEKANEDLETRNEALAQQIEAKS
jgi:predicted  nucleic acid-binding Zn-ribbon protein